MSNAEKIYEQIISLAYIEERMIGKDFENTWLDCKQKARAGREGIDSNDIKNFAKAISGFANSSGGVLLFGLDARKSPEGIDVVQSINPIDSLTKFEQDLRENETRIVERLVPGIEYKKFFTDEDNDKGIIVIYIPEGLNPPYRSLKDNKFYIRAGDSFAPIGLSQIESLVLKNMKPDLDINPFLRLANPVRHKSNIVNIDFKITNIGKSIAKYVLLEIEFPEGLDLFYRLVGADYKRRKDRVTKCPLYYWGYHKGIIHPAAVTDAPNFVLGFDNPDAGYPWPLTFKVSIYAENMPQKIYSLDVNWKENFIRLEMDKELEPRRDIEWKRLN